MIRFFTIAIRPIYFVKAFRPDNCIDISHYKKICEKII